MLAKAHRQPAPQFGWARDNYIGSTPQKNTWCDDWGAVLARAPDPSAAQDGGAQR
jgi:fructosamine-3-kinase